jgi:hypothetical protein
MAMNFSLTPYLTVAALAAAEPLCSIGLAVL